MRWGERLTVLGCFSMFLETKGALLDGARGLGAPGGGWVFSFLPLAVGAVLRLPKGAGGGLGNSLEEFLGGKFEMGLLRRKERRETVESAGQDFKQGFLMQRLLWPASCDLPPGHRWTPDSKAATDRLAGG